MHDIGDVDYRDGQAYFAAPVGSQFRNAHIVSGLRTDAVGNITIESQSWGEYWGGGDLPGLSFVREAMNSLRDAWSRYIESEFNAALAPPYCHAFFCLLRSVLDCNNKEMLRRVLCFENFRVTNSHITGAAAAGTTTIRNPVYLLAKLREPLAFEDPKFLPLISLPAADGKPELFYRYRRYKIADQPDIGLLLYPSIDPERHRGSFGVLEALAAALRKKPDPRVGQRANLIAKLAVQPFLSRVRNDETIRFLDLGAGSGALASQIFQRLSADFPDARFSCKFFDLDVRDPSTHFHSPRSVGT